VPIGASGLFAQGGVPTTVTTLRARGASLARVSASAVREGLLAVRRHGEQGRLGGEKRFYPWLSVIASRLCIDVARRRARSKPVDAEALSLVSGGTESPEEVLASKWDEAELLDAVGRLPRRHREVLALRALGDWPYERIASHSGMSIAGVKSLIWRARSALREELAEAPGLRARIGALGLVGGGIPRLVVGKRRACAHLANLHRQAGYARRAATVNAAGVVALAALALGTGILAGTSSGQAGEKATRNPQEYALSRRCVHEQVRAEHEEAHGGERSNGEGTMKGGGHEEGIWQGRKATGRRCLVERGARRPVASTGDPAHAALAPGSCVGHGPRSCRRSRGGLVGHS